MTADTGFKARPQLRWIKESVDFQTGWIRGFQGLYGLGMHKWTCEYPRNQSGTPSNHLPTVYAGPSVRFSDEILAISVFQLFCEF